MICVTCVFYFVGPMFVKNKLNLLAISTVSVILKSPLKYIGNDLFLLDVCKISFIVFLVSFLYFLNNCS